MARAILFDLDGVLVHSGEAWFALMNAAARDMGYPAISRERYAGSFGQSAADDVRDFFPGRTVGEVNAYFSARFRDHARHMSVTPGGAAVVERLRARGVGTAVVTNSPRALALELLAAAEVRPDALVAGDEVERPKPAPDMVSRACRELRAEPRLSWLVGDSRFDREAARAAGVRFCGYGGIEGEATIAALEEVERLLDEGERAAPGGPS